MKRSVPTKAQCNQYVRHPTLGIEQCCAPAAFMTPKAGQRWCRKCLDDQCADARARERNAKRDLQRLRMLQPFEVVDARA